MLAPYSFKNGIKINVVKLLNEAVPAAQVATMKEAMEKLKNPKGHAIDLEVFTINPALLTRIW